MGDRGSELIRGGVDTHVHTSPSPYPRRVDTIQAARAASEAGLRAIVVKSHHHCTATQILALRDHGLEDAGIQVLGGIVLNTQVGGINPHAVSHSLAMGGRVVWLPTIAAPAHLAQAARVHLPHPSVRLLPEEPVDVLDSKQEPSSEFRRVAGLVADADAVLVAGHLAAESIMTAFSEARAAGVHRLLVSHPNFIVGMSIPQAAELTQAGVYIEHAASMYDDRSEYASFDLEVLEAWIEGVGVERTILASDLGQVNNPLPAESLALICERLVSNGMSEDAVRSMVAGNPARLLGLD